MVDLVRLAVIGAGNIGARHLALAAGNPHCKVVAVADPAPAAASVANRYDARFHRDFREMLATEQLDGVIIATPNDRHADVGIACAEQRLPMLMEKPITDTIEAGEALLAAAARHDVAIAVGHHRRFDPVVEIARDAIDGGRIGRLGAVQCIWSLRKHDSYYDPAWRSQRPSGGPILINLIHDLDLLRYLCGDIARVYAEGGSTLRGNEVEDVVAVTLRFASGVLATVIASDAAPSPWGWELGTGENPEIPQTGRNCLRFLGTEGSLALPRLELWRHDEGQAANWHQPIHCETLESPPRASLQRQLTHFCGVVRGEHLPRTDAPDGLRTLKTALAMHQAMTSGLPVDVV